MSCCTLLNPQHPGNSPTFYPSTPSSPLPLLLCQPIRHERLELYNQLCVNHETEPTYDIRNDLVRYQLAVHVPILSVFLPTSLIIPDLPMDEKDNEESKVEVGDGGAESSR
jgi:hypothetical protein